MDIERRSLFVPIVEGQQLSNHRLIHVKTDLYMMYSALSMQYCYGFRMYRIVYAHGLCCPLLCKEIPHNPEAQVFVV
jgi:hypothetical protein